MEPPNPASPLRRRIAVDRPRPRRPVGKLGAKRLVVQETPLHVPADSTVKSAPTTSAPQAKDARCSNGQQKSAHSQRQEQRRAEPARSLRPAGQLQAAPSPLTQNADDSGDSDWWLEGQLVARPPSEIATESSRGRLAGGRQRAIGEAGLMSQVQRGFQALMDGETYVQQRAHQLSGRPGPSAETFVDKGLDAFSSMSRVAVGVATTLDSAFENLLEGWSSPIERAMGRRTSTAAASDDSSGDSAEQSPVAAASPPARRTSSSRGGVQGLLPRVLNPHESVEYLTELWGNRKTLSSIIGPKAPSTPPPQRQKQLPRDEPTRRADSCEEIDSMPARLSSVATTAVRDLSILSERSVSGGAARGAPASEWDASWDDALGCDAGISSQAVTTESLAAELESMRVQQAEFLRLRTQLERMQGDLVQSASRCSQLSEENSVLRRQAEVPPPPVGVSPRVSSRQSPPSPHEEHVDPFTEQVRSQLVALLAEKAALAAENERLAHENCGLQELLQYSMQASGLDDYEGGSGEGRDACDRSDVLSDWSSVEGYAIAHGEVPCGDGIHEELSV